MVYSALVEGIEKFCYKTREVKDSVSYSVYFVNDHLLHARWPKDK